MLAVLSGRFTVTVLLPMPIPLTGRLKLPIYPRMIVVNVLPSL